MDPARDRMLEIGLHETAGRHAVPDIRPALYARIRAHRRRRLLVGLAALAAGVLAAIWVTQPRGASATDARLAALLARIRVPERGERSHLLSLHEDLSALRGVLDQEPQAWPPLRARVADLLERPLRADVRSRLCRLLAAREATALLARQLEDHADALDAACLVHMVRLGIDSAAELLRRRDPAGRRHELLQRAYLLSVGDSAQLVPLQQAVRQPRQAMLRPEQYFAAVLALYRAGSFGAWDVGYAALREEVLARQAGGEVASARDLCLLAAWFYRQLNRSDPLDLGDTWQRARPFVAREAAGGPPAAVIDHWLQVMR